LALGDNHAQRILCKFTQGATIEEICLSHDIEVKKKGHANLGGVVVDDDAPNLHDLTELFAGYSVADLLEKLLKRVKDRTMSYEEFRAEVLQDPEWNNLTKDLATLRDLVVGSQKAPNDTVLGGKGAFSKILSVQNDLAKSNVERVCRWSAGKLDRLKTEIIELADKIAQTRGWPLPWNDLDVNAILIGLSTTKRSCDLAVLHKGLKNCLSDWEQTSSDREIWRPVCMLRVLIRCVEALELVDSDELQKDINGLTQALVAERQCDPPWNVDANDFVDKLCEKHHCGCVVLCSALEECLAKWKRSGSGGFDGYVMQGLIETSPSRFQVMKCCMCGNMFLYEERGGVRCSECKAMTCSDCGEFYHEGVTCERAREVNKGGRFDRRKRSFI
jgi:hypothetical protein